MPNNVNADVLAIFTLAKLPARDLGSVAVRPMSYGCASGEIIRSRMFKRLVKIAGRSEVLGRLLLYGTTKKFLGVFGLNTLKDLPEIEELKKPQQ